MTNIESFWEKGVFIYQSLLERLLFLLSRFTIYGMNEPLVADRYGSVEWVDKPVDIDTTYTENVELVPTMTSQATVTPMWIENHVDELFELDEPNPFAYFEEYKGYKTGLKKLFFRRILSSFDPETAIEMLDDILEKGFEDDDEQAEALFEMLHGLENLNTLLDEIILNILSTLKP